jgi:hypothetical protein
MKHIIILIIALLSTPVIADDIRLTTLSLSRHHTSDHRVYNEVHGGVGIEAKFGDYWYGYTEYTDSYYQPNQLFTIAHEGRGGFGIVGGFATGYEEYPVVPMFGVTARWSFLRLTVTPVVSYLSFVVPLL